MLSARQLLLMRGACDRTISVAIAPSGAIALLPDPDLRWRVFRCISHVVLDRLTMDRGDGCSWPFSPGKVFLQVRFPPDSVAKLPKCRSPCFSQMDKTSGDRRSTRQQSATTRSSAGPQMHHVGLAGIGTR